MQLTMLSEDDMFLSDKIPIIVNTPREYDYITLYFIHDIHYGAENFNAKKFERLRKRILDDDRAYVCIIGDLMDNAIPDSKSSVFTQTVPPAVQKEWVVDLLKELGNKVIAVVPGNHESNRSTRKCGLYPLYDACLLAGMSDRYRDTYAIADIGVGKARKDPKKQVHYVVQIQHKAKDLKSYSSADFTDGIDIFAYGHDHDPSDKPRKKIVYDAKNKSIYERNIEVIDCGACLTHSGYGAKEGYRPQSDKMWRCELGGINRYIETTGFYAE